MTNSNQHLRADLNDIAAMWRETFLPRLQRTATAVGELQALGLDLKDIAALFRAKGIPVPIVQHDWTCDARHWSPALLRQVFQMVAA